MYRIILAILVLAVMALGFACGGGTVAPGSSGDSPTEAYKRLYAAVKKKDVEAIKAQMTAKSLDFGKMASERNNKPLDEVLANGFTATTFSEKLPEIRDQRLNENMGSVEVYNSKDSRWEDLPFINENGSWKLAVGELFAGSFKSPGKGRDALEKEAANAVNGGPVAGIPTGPNTTVTNVPMNANVIIPKAATNASNAAADAKKK